jgi:hypothetical protein
LVHASSGDRSASVSKKGHELAGRLLLYSAFAETFGAFRGIDFATRLRWPFDLKPRAIAGGANNLSQTFCGLYRVALSMLNWFSARGKFSPEQISAFYADRSY